MTVFTLKVVEIRKEIDDAVTLCFKQPGLKKIKYLAGQYITLIIRINGRRYIRPYSFSSCPEIDKNLEVTVKRVPNGIVSNHINDVVKEGDAIEVLSAMGDFIFNEFDGQKSIYLWGIGSGITPLISITKFVLNKISDLKVNLIYGNKNFENTIFLDQILQLSEAFPDRIIVQHFHTRLKVDEQLPDVIQGRIDKSKVISIVQKDKDLEHSAHYICGPAGLKKSVKEGLRNFNIDEAKIFSEEFELIKDPKDFIDIHTRQLNIEFNGKNITLEVVKGKSILEAGLDADIELPYSCQTGNCSTCKGKLLKGQVKMIGLNKKREDLKDDEYLLCCSHPLTDDVSIKI